MSLPIIESSLHLFYQLSLIHLYLKNILVEIIYLYLTPYPEKIITLLAITHCSHLQLRVGLIINISHGYRIVHFKNSKQLILVLTYKMFP